MRQRFDGRRLRKAIREFREDTAALFADEDFTSLVRSTWVEMGHAFREVLYNPAVTLWIFLTQVLSADHSCRNAVANFIAQRIARGLRPCSEQTGAYCIARKNLPEELFSRLVRKVGDQLQQSSPDHWLFKGRRVKVADGTTVSMPDTAENQKEYPQHNEQAPGVGFPIARMVVMFSLAVGSVLDFAISAYAGKGTGEQSLIRKLWHTLQAGDILLADRIFCGYFDIAELRLRNVDTVMRKHQMRLPTNFRSLRLGKDDHLVIWHKPQRPKWMDIETYNRMPDVLLLREIRVHVRIPGFRVKTILLITTLRNADEFTRQDLADLYRQRWEAELDLRSLKVTLQMDILRCKTPEMVRKEIYMHWLCYNLVRQVMMRSAQLHNIAPRNISFKGALQTINALRSRDIDILHDDLTAEALLVAIAGHRVGNRPNRIEPREVKRRPKPYKLLTEPRTVARSRLLNGS